MILYTGYTTVTEAKRRPITVTIVKNSRDYLILGNKTEQMLFDHRRERDVDYYYLRVKLKDGRMAWTSPVWVGGTK